MRRPGFIVLALLGMVLAVLIWGMEFSGWTISRHGFVRNNVQWNSTTIALIAILGSRRPNSPFSRKPRKGKIGMSQSCIV